MTTRIVIVGGGFGGTAVAGRLERIFRGRPDLDGRESVVEIELFRKDSAQCLVVVDQEYLLASIVDRHAAVT